MAGLSRDDLFKAHAVAFQNPLRAWIVAGDFDADRAVKSFESRLEVGAAPLAANEHAVGTPRTEAIGRRIILLDRPGSPQAAFRIGQVGVDRKDHRFYALLLFNQILGGQFSSRLNAVLREKKGMTYGIRSHFDFRGGPGPFSAAASVDAARVAEAVGDVAAQIELLLGDEPPTLQELDDARRSIVEGQARQFETISDLAGRFAGLFVQDLPIDEYRRLSEWLHELDSDDLVEQARQVLKPDRLVTVVVADADATAPRLEELGWGLIERIDDRSAYQP